MSVPARPAIFAATLLLTSCGRAADPVKDCLARTVVAAEKRDADGVMARVAEGFRDAAGGDRRDASALVHRTLAAYRSLSLSLTDVVIERGPASAHAKFRVRMSGTPRAAGGLEGILPRSSRWAFDVRLESGSGGWKITWASWVPLGEAN